MKKLITALILIFATAVWAGDFEDGSAAYKKGDFKTAVRLFQKVAIKGYSSAQYNLALMYKKGEGVVQDYAEAVRWFKLSAAQGDSDSQINLALMYQKGEGVVQDYAEAARWFKLSAAQGDSSAQINLAVRYYYGEGVLQDYLQAHMWMNLAAVSGDKDAQKIRDAIAAKMTSQQIAKAQAMAQKCLASQYKDCE
jgi:TPR repeat protein